MHTILNWISVFLIVVITALCDVHALAEERKMAAHFIDVGQGHATLLEFPCGAMLIDTGGQAESTRHLTDYLEYFFQQRPDLNRTLESVITTHTHPDHTLGLRAVVEQFNVKRYIDNGQLTGPGTANPKWVRTYAQTHSSLSVKAIDDADIPSNGHGLTSPFIDPFKCAKCDPKITILWSSKTEKPAGWSNDEFKNKNNHSIVTRIDFGAASFLFTGDLEDTAIQPLVNRYKNTPLLDVDVYQVGHHGSYNATTAEFLSAMTPKLALIPVGHWNFGKDGMGGAFNTWNYGHPRSAAIDLLATSINESRPVPIKARIADGVRAFRLKTISKNIYATAWDGDLVVHADTGGSLSVDTHIQVPVTPLNLIRLDRARGSERLLFQNN